MSTPNDGGPAFPQTERVERGDRAIEVIKSPGMSLRDWFAGQALAESFKAAFEGSVRTGNPSGTVERAAAMAYELAGAMLAARTANADVEKPS